MPLSKSTPLVSILMPVYNGERFIRESIESILNQTYANWELWIINDASTDQTLAMIKNYLGDARIKLLNQPTNSGSATACNRALQQAQGTYYAINDSDDISHPERIAQQVDFLESHPEIGMVGSCVELIDAQGKHLGYRLYPERYPTLLKTIHRSCPFLHSSTMIRMPIMRSLHGYDTSIGYVADVDLYFRILQKHAAYNLQTPYVQYRISPYQTTHQPRPILKAVLKVQRAYLFHPKYRSLSATVYYLMKVGLLLLPSPAITALFKTFHYKQTLPEKSSTQPL